MLVTGDFTGMLRSPPESLSSRRSVPSTIGDMSREWRGLVTALLAGLGSGVFAKFADESAAIGLVGDLLTGVSPWLLAAALLARFAPTPGVAALRVALFFVAMCAGYFGYADLVLDFPGPGPYALAWLFVSVTVMPALAFAYHWASRGRGVKQGLVAAAVAAGAAGFGQTRRAWLLWDSGFPQEQLLVPALVEILVCLLVAVVLPRHGLTRRAAALALVPTVVLTGVLANRFFDWMPFF